MVAVAMLSQILPRHKSHGAFVTVESVGGLVCLKCSFFAEGCRALLAPKLVLLLQVLLQCYTALQCLWAFVTLDYVMIVDVLLETLLTFESCLAD